LPDLQESEAHLQHEKQPLLRLLGRLLAALPLLLALFAVDPFREAAGRGGAALAVIVIALAAGLLLAEQPAFFPLALVAAQSIALRWSLAAAAVCTAGGASVFLLLLGLYRLRFGRPKLGAFFARLRLPRSVPAVFCLAAALVMTLYQGAGYFEVSARGAGVPELLRSYRTMGFHPNWRAVLFSTVMMVVLITWPRKFKKLHRTLPAPFVGIVIVTLLNLLLNPDPARTVVRELGQAGRFAFARLPLAALAMLLIYVAWESFAATLKRPKSTI
jgi:SulP family sulfate permease